MGRLVNNLALQANPAGIADLQGSSASGPFYHNSKIET